MDAKYKVNSITYDEQPCCQSPNFKLKAFELIEQSIQTTQLMDVANISKLIAEYGLNDKTSDEQGESSFDYLSGMTWVLHQDCLYHKIQIVFDEQGYMTKSKCKRSNGELLRECHYHPKTVFNQKMLYFNCLFLWKHENVKELSEWFNKSLNFEVGYVNNLKICATYYYQTIDVYTRWFRHEYDENVVITSNNSIPNHYFFIDTNTIFYKCKRVWNYCKTLFC